MRGRTAALLALLVVTLALATPGGAITFGTVDSTNRYPYVGALIAEWDQPGVKDILCSGTLVQKSPGNTNSNVFLTAGHCTAFLESIGIPPDEVWSRSTPNGSRG